MISAVRNMASGWAPWGAVFAWTAAIVAAPLLLAPQLPPATGEGVNQAFSFRGVIHLLEYGVLFILLLRAFGRRIDATALPHSRTPSTKARSPYTRALLFALAFALLDEMQQGLSAIREPSVVDVFTDGAGILLAFIGSLIISRTKPFRIRGAAQNSL